MGRLNRLQPKELFQVATPSSDNDRLCAYRETNPLAACQDCAVEDRQHERPPAAIAPSMGPIPVT